MDLKQIKIYGQYLLPKHLLTRLVGLLAAAKMGKITAWAIQQFVKIYDINMQEAENKVEDYATFNEFFSRGLKKNARPIDAEQHSIVSPADGKISQSGKLIKNLQMQAKGHYFSVDELLADENDAKKFADGDFITIYLSPRDYHRVHIPCAGKLLKMTYVPGELFSVNPLYTQNIPELFSRNERVVCLFETEFGKMAVILVGAAIVRSIYMNWHGIVAPHKSRKIEVFDYAQKNIRFAKGEEIGKFMMGSTVICLFAKNKIEFAKKFAVEEHILVGQKIALPIQKKTAQKKSARKAVK